MQYAGIWIDIWSASGMYQLKNASSGQKSSVHFSLIFKPHWIGGIVVECSIDAAQQQMALNFELVVSDQILSVVLAVYKLFKISGPGVGRQHMWQLDGKNISTFWQKIIFNNNL